MQPGSQKAKLWLFALGIFVGAFLALGLLKTPPAAASTGINQTINFQGRLLNAQGATVPDGYYNIEFKIYQDGDGQSAGDSTGSPSGSLKWTEDYLNQAGHGVKVVNGYMSVNLGSITPFGSNINWNQNTLWLSMNIGGTGASCTPFSSCSPDGEMLPMQPLTTAPYALNSGELGGLSSSQFVQLAQGVQTDTSNVTAIGVNKTGSGKIIDLQNNSTDVFTVDTSGNTVGIGITGSTNANSTVHIADSSAGIQTVTIGSTSSSSATTIQAGSGGISLGANTTLAANSNFTYASGSGGFDAHNSSGTFQTSTGANSLNGATTVTGTNSFTVNGGLSSLKAGLSVNSGAAGTVGAIIQGASSQTAALLQLQDSTGANL
ncbi:MAG TPA: hypothetical protein VEH48_00600, partial [Candidatus Nitrosopolaris sp.]|nr:hypothetical protein [Candidatus Nitrosopolaris sp.]